MNERPSQAPQETSAISRTATVLTALMAVGLLARVIGWALQGGFHYPDEIFQQLEPAHYLRTGVGWLPWEYQRGLRCWAPPAFYAALMEALSWVGLQGHAALRAVNLHNALWTAAMIPAAYRAGRALGHGAAGDEDGQWAGVWTAALVALWPTLLYFAPHALQGTPSMVCLTLGYASWLELRRADPGEALGCGFWMGFWFGVAGMLRFTSGLHMLVPLAELLLARRWRGLAGLTLGSLPGIAILGISDAVTWGKPFHSAIEHFTYNYIEGKASDHGVSPWHFYLIDALGLRAGPLAPVALVLLALGLRRGWPAALTAALPMLLLSTVAHKEERFLMHNWPLWLMTMGVGLAALQSWWARRSNTSDQRRLALMSILVAALIASNAYGSAELQWRWRAGLFQAQAFVGAQPDATGLLFDDRQHLNGGHLVLNRTIPQLTYSAARARDPLFNFAALQAEDRAVTSLERAGWRRVATFEGFVVLKRAPRQASDDAQPTRP